MNDLSPDLTIDGVMADPVIAAAMQADGVDPRRLEGLLRATARSLRAARAKALPLVVLADRVGGGVGGSCPAW